jgi:hypothetical protein
VRDALTWWAASLIGVMSLVAGTARGQTAQKVSPCSLVADPAAYDHRLIEVTGFISHGFEDFSLFDPTCTPRFRIWLEYGGVMSSGTVYCCIDASDRSRPHPLTVEGVSIPLVRDDVFDRFDDVIQLQKSVLLHATLVGRFFAGSMEKAPSGALWPGYGHLGCCSLLAIEEVRSIEANDRKDVDDDPDPDQPDISGVGCGYRELTGRSEDRWIRAQRDAENRPSCIFDDPERVAEEALEDSAGFPGAVLKEVRRDQSRVVYSTAEVSGSIYMVVVSRPYLVTFYARDPTRVVWIAIAVYEEFCGVTAGHSDTNGGA